MSRVELRATAPRPGPRVVNSGRPVDPDTGLCACATCRSPRAAVRADQQRRDREAHAHG